MLMVSDNNELDFHAADMKFKLEEFIMRRQYRVSDSPLTYRQINNLAVVGILSTTQEKEGGWRKFSFAELVFLEVVQELRTFGFKTEQLQGLRKAFFLPERRAKMPNSNLPEPAGYAFMAIGMTMGGVQIILTVDASGSVCFYDPVMFVLFAKQERTFVQVNLNKIVNSLFQRLGHKGFDYKTLFDIFVHNILSKDDLDDKERELFEAIRSGEYETVEVLQENGKVKVFRGTSRKRGDFTPHELMEVLKAKSYQTVTAYMQDGKIASYTVEETKK